MTNWTYEFFYFGNANWPPDATWRVADDGRKELLIEQQVSDRAEAKYLWDETGTERDSDPHVVRIGSSALFVGWWRDLGSDTEEYYSWARRVDPAGPSPWGLDYKMEPL